MRCGQISRNKFNSLMAGLSGLSLLWSTPLAAFAQSQHWDLSARQRSQTLVSEASNYLAKATTPSHDQKVMDLAIDKLLQAVNADPNDVLPLQMLGLALDMQGKYQEALDNLAKAYKLAPTNNEVVLAIGLTQYLAHNYDKAIDVIQRLISTNPKNAAAYLYLGFAHLRQGDFSAARDAFRQSIVAVPNSQAADYGLALAAYFGGELSQARSSAEHAATSGKYPPVILLLASIDVLQADFAAAHERAELYIKLTKNDFAQRAMTDIGFAKAHDFHWDPFLTDFFDNGYLLEARLLDPVKQASKQRSLVQRGHVSQMLAAAQKSANSGEDFVILHELGLLSLSSYTFADATTAFQNAVTKCPSDNVDLLYLSMADAATGDMKGAGTAAQTYVQKHPDQRIAQSFVTWAQAAPPPPASAQPATPLKRIDADSGF